MSKIISDIKGFIEQDIPDESNEFDVSVTNTSDFSFDTADVDAISPIEMIN